MSLFEDSNDDTAGLFRRESKAEDSSQALRAAQPKVGAAVAKRSLPLERMTASFMVDAAHFFNACQPEWTWSQLRSLVLTSRVLDKAEDRSKIYDLLNLAGTTALHMPKLHVLSLWNWKKGQACAFTYRRNFLSPSITWRATWGGVLLESHVASTWRRVASEHTPKPLRIRTQLLYGEIIRFHGDAICSLRLPSKVINTTSLWQMSREMVLGRDRTAL
jgi:hypothetical protein